MSTGQEIKDRVMLLVVFLELQGPLQNLHPLELVHGSCNSTLDNWTKPGSGQVLDPDPKVGEDQSMVTSLVLMWDMC